MQLSSDGPYIKLWLSFRNIWRTLHVYIQASSKQSQSFVIKYENNNVKAFLPESNVNIQLTLQGMKLASIYDKTKCFVTPRTISGCYNCLSGANFQYDCKTEGRQSSIAYVNCSDSISFAIPCNNQEDSIRISINRAEVATLCTVSCPAGQSSFNLTNARLCSTSKLLGTFGAIYKTAIC